MNVWLTRAALRVRGLSPGARVVLLAHADACRPSGRICLAGLDELAEACELSPKHVMRLRAQLVEAGRLRKLAAAHPGQRPVYEVLPAVPIPVPPGQGRGSEPDRVATSGRTAAGNESHGCDSAYKPQGITPPTPQPRPTPANETAPGGGREILHHPTPNLSDQRADATRPPAPDPSTLDPSPLVAAAVAALRPDHRTRIDELGRYRLERAAAPLADGWTPADLSRRIGAERLDRAENLPAVLCAVLRRYALEPAPRELRAAERAAHQRKAGQPPPEPCAHGDPGGCTACPFCRRRLADPDGQRCQRCTPPVPLPQVVSA